MTLCPKPLKLRFERSGKPSERLNNRFHDRAQDYQLFICGAEHESAAAWLAAATATSPGIQGKNLESPQMVQPFNQNDRIRRTSILRQSSQPVITESPESPTSPTEKKNVRFADSMGGQLELIKYYVTSPEVRRRHSTYAAPFLNSQFYNKNNNSQKSSLVPTNFTNPSLRHDFYQKLAEKSVLLHSITTAETTVYGIISVMNHSFTKKVFVRYTCNDWKRFNEVEANYMLGSHEERSDKFSFTISSKPKDFTLSPQDLFHPRLFFAIRFQTDNGQEYWDNNDNRNYCLNFLASDYMYNLKARNADIQFF